MKKILSVIALIAAVSMLVVACSIEPEENVWVQDKDLPTSGGDVFAINFTGAAVNGVAYTGDMQIYSNLLGGWGTHPIVPIALGDGIYVNTSIAKGTDWQIAACFATSNPAAAWGAEGPKLDNSQGKSNWAGKFNGYQYKWDMSLTVGPEEMDAVATVAK